MGKKLGLVLSGGGARGAYQIGVAKKLEEAGILDRVNVFAGASVGSLNACLLATRDLSIAESLWFTIDHENLFNEEQSFIKRLFNDGANMVYKGYYDTGNFEALIDEYLDYDVIYNNDVYVAVSHVGDEQCSLLELMTLNIRNFFDKDEHIRYSLLKTLSKKDIKKTLIASCAIPIVFKPIVINNETFYDGGVLDNAPYQPLIDAGCDEIIVIDLFRFRMSTRKMNKNVKIHHIKPSKNLGGILDFNPSKIRKRYETGLTDGEKFVKQWKMNQK